jgi:hypothetical protein
MNVFDLNLAKNCNIILCKFSLYNINKLSCKQIKYLSRYKKERPFKIILPASYIASKKHPASMRWEFFLNSGYLVSGERD